MKDLNKIIREMMGHRLTKKEKQLLETLQKQVRAGSLTVEEAKKIWNVKVLKPHGEKLI